jgi:CheY-like chemotaxis protein
VLVIEDETPVANLIRLHLEMRGFRVLIAHDGQQGMEMFRSESPAVVVTDLLLPKRNGFRILDEIHEQAPHVPVVVVTGVYRSEAYRSELSHARLFLTKPLEAPQLDQLVELVAAHVAAGTGLPETTDPIQPARGKRRSHEPWVPTSLVPLPRMLSLLWRGRKTGNLTLRLGERRTVFQLEAGRLQFVRSNDPEMRLDGVLLQLGRLSREALARARQALAERAGRARLGEVLVEQGTLSVEALHQAVQLQLRRIVAAAFAQGAGATLFRAEAEPCDEEIRIDADIRAVVVAGCASMRDESEILRGHLPDDTCPLVLQADPDDPALKLSPLVRQLVRAAAGDVRTRELIAMADMLGLPGRPLVFGLLCAEVLGVGDHGAEWSDHAPASTRESRALEPGVPPMAHVLELECSRATGVLDVRAGERASWVSFQAGAITAAGSDDVKTRIGERLLAAELVTPEELQAALEAQAGEPGKPLGRILVERNVLGAAQLIHAVRAQTVGIARDVLLAPDWEEATFTPDRVPERELVSLGVSTADIVLEALRACPPSQLERLAGRLAASRPRLDLEALRGGRFQLADAEEVAARGLSDDTAQVLRGLAGADDSDPDVLRTLVAALLVTPAGVEVG